MSKLGEDLPNALVFISIEVSIKQKLYRNIYQPLHVGNLYHFYIPSVEKKLLCRTKVVPNEYPQFFRLQLSPIFEIEIFPYINAPALHRCTQIFE
jgi:hypothetical protein